ncbi:MAG: hypothetical protein WD737_06025 [Gemmatimonadota bacterium]
MAGLSDLMREYERARFPAHRRLDLHGEGPRVARERALRWIQSRAHEAPGEELLLILERGGRPGRGPSPAASEVGRLLRDLEGKLIDWWQPFAPGSLAVRIANEPNVLPLPRPSRRPTGDGRTEETAGSARPPPRLDIPPELYEMASRTAELRISREGLSIGVLEVVLREVWIEVQALAMERRLTFAAALEDVFQAETRKQLEM